MRTAIDEGLFPGPRLQVSVSVVSQTGGHGDWTLASGLNPEWVTSDLPAAIADSEDEMRKVARTIIRAGADWIKLCSTGGVLSPLDPPDTPQFTLEELGVAVYEARAARLRGVMAHAIGAEGVKNAVRAGIRSIEHGYMVDQEAIDLMVEHGTYLVPTLHALRSVRERADAKPGSMPDWAMAKLDTVVVAQQATLPEAIRAGIKVAMGTDCGVGYHGTNAREIGLLVEAGMTPMAAIEASTRVAAELLRRSDDIGTVEPGKLADVIAVDHDPLADPARIGDPASVRIVAQGRRRGEGQRRPVRRPGLGRAAGRAQPREPGLGLARLRRRIDPDEDLDAHRLLERLGVAPVARPRGGSGWRGSGTRRACARARRGHRSTW